MRWFGLTVCVWMGCCLDEEEEEEVLVGFRSLPVCTPARRHVYVYICMDCTTWVGTGADDARADGEWFVCLFRRGGWKQGERMERFSG